MTSTKNFLNSNGTYSESFQLGNGATIYQGPGVLSNSIGQSGDIFTSTTLGILYINIFGVWTPVAESSSVVLYALQLITAAYGTSTSATIGQDTSYDNYLAVEVNAPWCTTTLTFPSSPAAGLYVYVKDLSGTANFNYPISIHDSINNVNFLIDIPYGSIKFLYTGSKWVIISALTSYPPNQMKL